MYDSHVSMHECGLGNGTIGGANNKHMLPAIYDLTSTALGADCTFMSNPSPTLTEIRRNIVRLRVDGVMLHG